jgi:hypothetical protein
MLKSFLVALAVLVTVDAAAWDSRYRMEFSRACHQVVGTVASYDWTSGPLV